MNTLWVFHDNTYQSIKLSHQEERTMTIGNRVQDTVTLSGVNLKEQELRVHSTNGELELLKDERPFVSIPPNEVTSVTIGSIDVTFLFTSSAPITETFYVGTHQQFTLSTEGGEVTLPIYPFREEGQVEVERHPTGWKVKPQGLFLYVNGAIVEESCIVHVGDVCFVNGTVWTFIEEDLLQVQSKEETPTSLQRTKVPQSEMEKKYPMYRRTPRMVYEPPNDEVQFSFPSQESRQSGRSLWLIILPPLMMLIVMGLVALLIPRGIFIIVSIVMFTTTLITSTVQYFKDKKKSKEEKKRRKRVYTQYLETKRVELQDLADKQREVMTFHYPTFERMKYMTSQVSDRLWERTLESPDFLQYRIGIGEVPASYKLSVQSADMANREIDELLEQSQHLQSIYKNVDRMPVTVNLFQGAIGLIGKERVYKNELHQMIGQLAFFHSYHDVRFVFIFEEEEYGEWEWMKWLPHFQLPNSYAKGFIYNEQSRDQLLSSIYEMIRERDLEEDKEKLRFSPHFVFIVTNHQLISDHVILEYLEGESSHLGMSVIFGAEAKESLSDNVHTLVRYINPDEGDILIQEKKAVRIPFELDTHEQSHNEDYARLLRTLHHQVGMTNSIPDSVSFLEMLNVSDVNEIPIESNWTTRETAKSLAVPIGLKGKEDYVELNLHEKAHGPHGLLAGTTGSGKSEFLQTYILSLAVHFHPHEVAFLLIDYKGGGMAQPFKTMPHLLGTITNIEGSQNFSTRALASINSELKRRQRLFDEYQVNHINDYMHLYKQGEATEPMPHLFLISDEFAELKSEEPDFIKELVSAARIGRSLGVHLILATQKPGGVIDNQIWSNARFRVALKVQNAEDSREIIQNADAASLTVTGRGYLQVGNNEVYDLFQSAWSGAPYQEESSSIEDEIALVTDGGLVPLSEVSSGEARRSDSVSEIEAVVDRIQATEEQMGLKKLSSPWLPPLPNRLSRHDYHSPSQPQIPFALLDEPEKQAQKPFYYDVGSSGNIGIFGSSGYGKTTTALTLMMGMATNYSPEQLHFYVFDFGNGGLLKTKQLPHTGDYFLLDQERKVNKFMDLLKDEIRRRKQLFQRAEVSSIAMYNRVSEESLPFTYLVIDNFDIVKEEMQDLEATFNQFARDGQSLGIYVMMTATRVNSVRQSLANNLKTKVVHYLLDSTEAYSMLGRLPFAPEAIPGRAIVKKEDVHFSQVYLPTQGEDDMEQMEQLQQDIDALKKAYDGMKTPVSVPMLPSELTMDNFPHYVSTTEDSGYPIGLDEETVKPVHVSFAREKHCLVIGQAQKGKSNVLQVIAKSILNREGHELVLFDSVDRGMSHYAELDGVTYLESKDAIMSSIDRLEERLREREAMHEQLIQSGERPQFEPIVFLIDGYGRFLQMLDNTTQNRLVSMMKNKSHLGFHLVVSGANNEVTKGFEPLTVELKQVRQALLLMKKSDQTLFTLSYERKEPEIHPGYGYYVENGKERKFQIPLVSAEREVFS
ncbi:cell division protein FtsK [Pontibacillus halophilus JSM 076056 = DSM 19796]|uniref:Cell division protein FtsK n=1 Tax=Pontibacillus halophilus JSM 076056 = DSM 19796 TaxID=1385510 RepID=A0A0A5I5K7_9BACI|nr:type VII secretion protein EssC [Pontibacillus halophilus]KGX91112.1 cell division protein FtsK [Pontibacillus halophilus JSM 076056 = DSM 19796]